MSILEKINSSADVKLIPEAELPALCAALREEILHTVARTGGHLASSLGAVELIVALHREYDSATDRLVFDVGHQCYAHKLLTGRRDRFGTLRQFGGIAGFPRPDESGDDACISGHASVSVSVALGMSRARTLRGENYDVAAVIGDGALTGGAAYEGLSDCGGSGEPLVVILNDNAMAIRENVGGMARLLSKVRLRPGYIAFKRFYRRTVGRTGAVYRFLHRIKEWVKRRLMPGNMFEEMGFYYIGPVDGHDLKTLTRTISYARELREPVLLHVRTVKGRGYPPAERDPALYHGVGPFDVETGILPRPEPAEDFSFSQKFGEALCRCAERDRNIAAVTAAMADGTGLSRFAERFPERFFDVGIAEQHAAAMAAGMARQGLKPVFAVYSTFLQRSYDMLLHDVALSGEHVVLAVDRAGLVGADGATHQGAFDVGYLRSVPGMKIWAPSNYAELETMLCAALDAEGPCALRYARGGEGAFRTDTYAASSAGAALLREGNDVTIVSYGILINEALAAAEALNGKGISAAVVKLNRLDAPDLPLVEASAGKTGRLVVVEDTAAAGCLGEHLHAALPLNLGNGIVPHGGAAELLHLLKLDAEGIAAEVEILLHEEGKA